MFRKSQELTTENTAYTVDGKEQYKAIEDEPKAEPKIEVRFRNCDLKTAGKIAVYLRNCELLKNGSTPTTSNPDGTRSIFYKLR